MTAAWVCRQCGGLMHTMDAGHYRCPRCGTEQHRPAS